MTTTHGSRGAGEPISGAPRDPARATSLFRGIAVRRRASGVASLLGLDHVQGHRPRVAGDPGVRARASSGPRPGTPSPGHLRRARRSSTGRSSRRRSRSLLATPLSIAIALFLTEIAPRRLAAPIATMVELLAAIPSVVLGLWGILVFGPWVAEHLEPWLESALGCIPIFSGDPSPGGDAARRARAHDHDHPDHVGDLPRALHRARRAS